MTWVGRLLSGGSDGYLHYWMSTLFKPISLSYLNERMVKMETVCRPERCISAVTERVKIKGKIMYVVQCEQLTISAKTWIVNVHLSSFQWRCVCIRLYPVSWFSWNANQQTVAPKNVFSSQKIDIEEQQILIQAKMKQNVKEKITVYTANILPTTDNANRLALKPAPTFANSFSFSHSLGVLNIVRYSSFTSLHFTYVLSSVV
jgi:hypothetical protein